LAARIFAIVDVFDALTSERPYRGAWTRERTLEHILEGAGSHFDPDLVDAFMAMVRTER
jgi:HD-GYP domain-containing protein (c-di-GMP phosphodiesterase class II)